MIQSDLIRKIKDFQPILNKLEHNYNLKRYNCNRVYFNLNLHLQSNDNLIDILNPWWVTGFCDAESSFTMSIQKSNSTAIGWTIAPCFIITLHAKDLKLLKLIRKFFKEVGNITTSGDFVHYKVRSRKDLSIIIEHFNKYPLHTSKMISFVYFTKIYDSIGQKLHTNVNGFLQLASLINRLNKSLSASLMENLSKLGVLPNVELESPVINRNPDLNLFWISGFITGEGSFTYFTRTRKNSKNETVKDYTLVIEVSQDSKDGYILTSIQNRFKVGKVYHETRGITKYRLVIKEEIIDKLVPYFTDYSLKGNKALQYSIWIKIVNILVTSPNRTLERDNQIEILIRDLSSL